MQKHLEDDEKKSTANGIELDVAEDFKSDVGNMLGKHAWLWTGKKGQSNAADMWIYLIPHAKTFNSPPYHAGPKTRQWEQNVINRQLKSGVIEPAMS